MLPNVKSLTLETRWALGTGSAFTADVTLTEMHQKTLQELIVLSKTQAAGQLQAGLQLQMEQIGTAIVEL